MRKATYSTFLPIEAFSISIPAFREEGDTGDIFPHPAEGISIPAFREEGDRHTAPGG